MKDKIVTITIEGARIIELGETGARVALQGEPEAWQDVRLHLLAEDGTERPGKIYGKVTAVNPGADGRTEVEIRFTSVSPESRQLIRQALKIVFGKGHNQSVGWPSLAARSWAGAEARPT